MEISKDGLCLDDLVSLVKRKPLETHIIRIGGCPMIARMEGTLPVIRQIRLLNPSVCKHRTIEEKVKGEGVYECKACFTVINRDLLKESKVVCAGVEFSEKNDVIPFPEFYL